MEQHLLIKPSCKGTLWVSYREAYCEICGQKMRYMHHGRPRNLSVEGKNQSIVFCYYQCINDACPNRRYVGAYHPDVLPNKQASKSMFNKIVDLKYRQKMGKATIFLQLP